ncbi:MAG: hypothetical protein ACREIA_20165, partial [Opitutaceae bacterium]
AGRLRSPDRFETVPSNRLRLRSRILAWLALTLLAVAGSAAASTIVPAAPQPVRLRRFSPGCLRSSGSMAGRGRI